MSKGRDRMVYQRSDKLWVNKRLDASKVSSVHTTQGDAWKSAKEMLGNQGGGELIVKGPGNKGIVSKDTIKPGNDPNPPKDKEH